MVRKLLHLRNLYFVHPVEHCQGLRCSWYEGDMATDHVIKMVYQISKKKSRRHEHQYSTQA